MNEIAFQNRLTTYNLYNKVNKSQMRGMLAIIDYWESNKLFTDARWLAYILATVYHETGKSFEAIEEVGQGIRKPYGRKIKQNLRPYQLPDKLYYGRGLVQLTWYDNYDKFGKLLKIDLLNKPELALKLDVSIEILFKGMTQGLFTGVNLSRYFNDQREDYVSARKIINGTDKADLIALYAKKFLNCILM
jgi:putative chitinase